MRFLGQVLQKLVPEQDWDEDRNTDVTKCIASNVYRW